MPQVNGQSAVQSAPAAAAVAWGVLTFLAWCLSWWLPPLGSDDEAALTVAALVTQLVSVALRFPPKWTLAQSQTAAQRQVVWLGAWVGQINALGCVSMISPNLASVLPPLVVSALVEALLLERAPADWGQQCQQWLSGHLPALVSSGPANRPFAAEAINVAANVAANGAINVADDLAGDEDGERGEIDEAESAAELELAGETMRCTREGRSADGERYLSGWVRVALERGQKSTHVTIGFSPPFLTVPEIELDEDAESHEADSSRASTGSRDDVDEESVWSACEAQVEQATPAGMRIVIKRSDARSAYRGKVLWHASSAEAREDPSQIPAQWRGRLP